MNSGNLLRHPGFLRVLVGNAVSLLGDQFAIITIPWLVMTLTKESLVLSTVVAFMGLPRVIFLLPAGVLVDNYSPRTILIAASLAGSIVLGCFGGMVLGSSVTLWMLYGFAASTSLVTTFTLPASMALLPRVVAPEQLQAANSIMMGVTQLAVLAGPVLAGILISTSRGPGVAFLIDGTCFLIAALNVPKLTHSAEAPMGGRRKRIIASIFESFSWIWSDSVLRLLIAYWIVVAFLAIGTIQIGLPLLVKKQFGLNSTTFGLLIAINGVGQLLGILISGLRTMKGLPLGMAVCLVDVVTGLAMAGMGVNHQLAVALVLVFIVGIGEGFVQVGLYTWIQHRVPKHLLGRVISILSLAITVVAPISALLAGAFAHYLSVSLLFIEMGGLLSSFAFFSLTSRTIRSVKAID